MGDLESLDSQLLQAIGAIETLMARDTCDVATLSQLRYKTAQVIAARRPAIDALFNAAMAAGGERREAALALRSGNLDVRMQYSDHVGAWPIGRAARDLPGYLAAANQLSAAIRAQMDAERSALYPNLARALSSTP
ncbi:hypothetical protein ACX40Y_13635 [Sphingomonas sp. RS6]